MFDRRKKTEEIINIFYSVRRKIAQDMQVMFQEMNITHPQWMVLHHIEKDGISNIKQIAELLGITSSAVTQIVDSLVDKGLVTRKRNKSDRRILDLKLSEDALKYFKTFREKSLKAFSELFSGLDDQELEEYCRLSRKLTSGTGDKASPGKSKECAD